MWQTKARRKVLNLVEFSCQIHCIRNVTDFFLDINVFSFFCRHKNSNFIAIYGVIEERFQVYLAKNVKFQFCTIKILQTNLPSGSMSCYTQIFSWGSSICRDWPLFVQYLIPCKVDFYYSESSQVKVGMLCPVHICLVIWWNFLKFQSVFAVLSCSHHLDLCELTWLT